MSTCSTATSTHRGNESRRRRGRSRTPSSEAVRGHQLEMRLQDLERDWHAYKAGRSGARRHRRSRWAGSLSSSAVTVEELDDGFHIPLLRHSPTPRARRLDSSLQQTGSAVDVPAASRCDNEDASSVCSAEGGHSVAIYSSSCSCPHRCAILCCGGYSTSSSCTGTTVPPFCSDIDAGRARKMDEGKLAASRAVGISAIALMVVMGFVAMIILELGVDEGRQLEYHVPT